MALDGRGGVGRGRVACWASVATVALCRHDPYSIYLMFAIVALSPDALECPGKYVYHELVTDTQCAFSLIFNQTLLSSANLLPLTVGLRRKKRSALISAGGVLAASHERCTLHILNVGLYKADRP